MKWIKINNVDDLPNKDSNYYVHSKVDWHPFFRVDIFCGRLSNAVNNGKPIFTHYIEIIKPEPPDCLTKTQ